MKAKAIWVIGLAPLLLWAGSFTGCGPSEAGGPAEQGKGDPAGPQGQADDDEAVDDAALESEARQALTLQSQVGFFYDGSIIDALEFFRPHETGNGRSCATCHRPEDNFTLTPATVEARYQLLQWRRQFDPNADDPLFRSIDADDFDQDFTTLRTKALIRVVLPLPATVKLTNDPAATTTTLWRAVPTVMNAAITAPYQNDGRHAALEGQALGAMHDHSSITGEPKPKTLSRLANFQRHLFSSRRVRDLAEALANDEPLPNPEPPLNALEQEGKATFTQFCANCHGGPTHTKNTDARFLPVPLRGPLPGAQAFVDADAVTPRPTPGGFFEGLPTAGLPNISYTIERPNNTPALHISSDAGRVLITGDFRERDRFDVPTMYGIGRTAPYFHDNFAATLEDVVRHYQALMKFATLVANQGAFAPVVDGQGCNPGECGFDPVPEDKAAGLIAYLKKL